MSNGLELDKISSKMEKSANEVNSTIEMLSTQADRAGYLGFGRPILVPPDEIHVVVGDGRHAMLASKKRKIYGQAGEGSVSVYHLNNLTQVVKLKTVSFTVPLRGQGDGGIEALDKNNVKFRLWAHAVAKLNPEMASIAAQRVGLDTSSLISTITKVGSAELIAVAANMQLESDIDEEGNSIKGIIANRQELAKQASERVNKILQELGYDLALLTVTRIGGVAYDRLVAKAEAIKSKEATEATTKEQEEEGRILAKHKQAKTQIIADTEKAEAEIKREKEAKLAAEQLRLQTAELEKSEQLKIKQHELALEETERQESLKAKQHALELEERQRQRDKELKEREFELDRKLKLHERTLEEIERQKVADQAVHEAEQAKQKLVHERAKIEAKNLATLAKEEEELSHTQALIEAENKANLTQEQVERQAELRAEEQSHEATLRLAQAKAEAELAAQQAEVGLAQSRAKSTREQLEAEIRLKQTEAEANRLELEQVRQLEREAKLVEAEAEREAKRTQAETERLRAEELAKAERAKEVSLLEASQLAEAMTLEAEAQAKAKQLQTQAQTQAELRQAESEAKAKEITANADRIKAEAEAEVTEKQAQAAKVRAEATRAEQAAPGLAEAEIEEARLTVAEKQLEVTRKEGLAEAEVAKATAQAEAERIRALKAVELDTERQRVELAERQVEITREEGLAEAAIAKANAEAETTRIRALKEIELLAEKQQAELYGQIPALVEIEKTRLELAHQERIAKIEADAQQKAFEAQQKAFEAIAPSIRINIHGNGGQTSKLLNEVMSFSQSIQYLGDEVPWVGRFINGDDDLNGSKGNDSIVSKNTPETLAKNGASDEINKDRIDEDSLPSNMALVSLASPSILNGVQRLLPYITQALGEVNPRMHSTLKVTDLVDRVGAIISGDETMVTALNNLRQDANFRMVGDMPVKPFLNMLGFSPGEGNQDISNISPQVETPSKTETALPEAV